MWYVDEFGAFSALAAILVAVFFWSRRNTLVGERPLSVPADSNDRQGARIAGE